MKKIVGGMAMILLAGQVLAQKLYVRVGLGYAAPQATQTLNINGNPYGGNATYSPITDSISSFSTKKTSFSAGLKGIFGIGYNVSKHVALELYTDIGLASTKYVTELSNVRNVTGAYLVDTKTTQNAALPVMLMPAAVFHTNKTALNFYGRAGLVFPLNSKIAFQTQSNYNNATQSVEKIKGTLYTNFSIGFAGAGGISYAIAKKTTVWAEFNVMSMALYVKESKITEHIVDDANPDTFNPIPKDIKYSSSGKASSTEQPTYSLPFSNMGLAVGLSFGFL